MWVFGYGSLVWRADFPFKRKLIGYIRGYVRRFYQSSEDHRGVPGKPGLVVTIVPSSDPEAQVWGIAYEIAKEDEDHVQVQLDHREIGGYDRQTVIFYPQNNCVSVMDNDPTTMGDPEPFALVIYVGRETNPWYVGPLPLETAAKRILHAHGKSGLNRDYLYNLATAMRDIAPGIEDEHLFTLDAAVRELERQLPDGSSISL